MSSAKSAAADYHRGGWCPIPIQRGSKHPALEELEPYLSRPATTEELRSWRWPGVGIVTGPVSGVLVLDVDDAEGEAVLRKYGHPVTPMARTPSGGMHLYFKHPEHHVRTRIKVAPGLDVKASGGYAVAPPSAGPNGRPYEWIIPPEEAELADPPGGLWASWSGNRLKGQPRQSKIAYPRESATTLSPALPDLCVGAVWAKRKSWPRSESRTNSAVSPLSRRRR